MARALRCFGFVCKGVGTVVLIAAGLVAMVAALIFISVCTVSVFGLSSEYAPCLMIFYLVLAFGILVGVDLCRENR